MRYQNNFQMPNRMLRDWTDSDKINNISVYAERFFTRLIMKVDDYGCFVADVRLLKANLFPLLLDSVREADLLRWMTECQKAGLIVLYECSTKKYVQIIDFKQRLDKARAKYPLPIFVTEFPEVVTEFPAELEVELEVEKETNVVVPDKPASPKINFEKRQKDFYADIAGYISDYDKDTLRNFYDYWREPNKSKSKMRWEQERTWDLNLRLKKWENNNFKFNKNGIKSEKIDLQELPKNIKSLSRL